MKTSFYFVLWIIIYPLLSSLGSEAVNENAFLVALISVIVISYILNRWTRNISVYDYASQTGPILEDIYNGNVNSFKKRLSRHALIEIITACYLVSATIAILIFSQSFEWVALTVFVILSFQSISYSIKLISSKWRIRRYITPEECIEIAENAYNLNYTEYYEARTQCSYADMFPPRPSFYKLYQVCSISFAAVAILLGAGFIVSNIINIFLNHNISFGVLAIVGLLYGSLAIYFGVKYII